MPAWFLLPAAMAAVKGISRYQQAKNQPVADKRRHTAFKQKANTGYLKRYMADLRGRSGDRARTELAMRPALRAIGAQQAKGQRQLAYQSAQQGLTGSGIEAQKQLTLQQGTTQAVAGVGEKVLSQQLAQAQQMQAQKEGQRMKLAGEIGRQEAGVSEANRRAQFQADQANIAEQQAYDQRVAQKEANVTSAMWQGVTDVATSAIGGYGKQEMGNIAATEAAGLREEEMNFQLQLAGLQGNAEGGVAGVPKKGYQTGGVAQEDELVEFISGNQGYQQALQNYQVQQNEARATQYEDKSKQFKLYNTKLDQIRDIEEKRPYKDGRYMPLPRSQKNKRRKLKKETEVEALPPEEVKPYELTRADSSKIARDYLADLAGRGVITPKGFATSFENFRKRKSAAVEMDVDNTMTEYYEQAFDGDVNSDEIFATLRDPNFMKSKNFKTHRTSLVKVLNDQQAEIEQEAGADKKVADKRGVIKREIVQNVHSLGEFFKTATKVGEKGKETYDIQDNFHEVLVEMKHMIAADDGGIPDWTHDEILGRVKDIVNDLTIPLSRLQDISEGNRKIFNININQNTGSWQIEGGDAKFKRILIEELTKDLSKAVMWDDNATVEGSDKDKKDADPLELGD